MEANFEGKPEKLSLHDRLGGSIFISLAVEKFCDRLLADTKLKDLFAQENPETLKKKIGVFAGELFKNSNLDLATQLGNLPSPFPLSESQFNRGISHLIAALVWIGVNRELIEAVLDTVSPLSSFLVGPDGPDFTQSGAE